MGRNKEKGFAIINIDNHFATSLYLRQPRQSLNLGHREE